MLKPDIFDCQEGKRIRESTHGKINVV